MKDITPAGDHDEQPTDEELLASLARLWQVVDPMPDDLPERIVVHLALAGLTDELSDLLLIASGHELEGARAAESLGDTSRGTSMEFAGGGLSMLLRLTPQQADVVRLDGWVDPPGSRIIVVSQRDGTWHTRADEFGRFEFPELPPGNTRITLGTGARPVTTQPFPL